ncbi:hypothetical protein [Cryobacterium sp. TMS1-13-1]|uniref:CG0192-related protein n=1 Tax=Cryobacterium sp. TMS1-13-1 TaxID=1259220 RepID=UPI0010691423|nr:hypothetical protein [Cryobacterium sp. TMS1-13-1]TFD22974.1 hypothetical protein E3T31_06210 [Cryobacterium sp. TMS1-13-1]
MALLYDAVLRPSKSELIAAWAPTQTWFVGDVGAEVERVASFRFDDPDGGVGIETILVRFGTGPLLQIPLTYRGAPLEGGGNELVGTMSHSVLGDRWVYDATGDPVYLAAVAAAALTGGQQADQFTQGNGELIPVAPTATVRGSGTPGTPVPERAATIDTVSTAGTTIATAGALRVTVVRVLDGTSSRALATNAATVLGTWAEQSQPQLLLTVGVSPD